MELILGESSPQGDGEGSSSQIQREGQRGVAPSVQQGTTLPEGIACLG